MRLSRWAARAIARKPKKVCGVVGLDKSPRVSPNSRINVREASNCARRCSPISLIDGCGLVRNAQARANILFGVVSIPALIFYFGFEPFSGIVSSLAALTPG